MSQVLVILAVALSTFATVHLSLLSYLLQRLAIHDGGRRLEKLYEATSHRRMLARSFTFYSFLLYLLALAVLAIACAWPLDSPEESWATWASVVVAVTTVLLIHRDMRLLESKANAIQSETLLARSLGPLLGGRGLTV